MERCLLLVASGFVLIGPAPARTDPCKVLSVGIYDYWYGYYNEAPTAAAGSGGIRFTVYLHLDTWVNPGCPVSDCHCVALYDAYNDPGMPPYPDGIFEWAGPDPRLAVAFASCSSDEAAREWADIVEWIEWDPTCSVGANWGEYSTCECACRVPTYDCD